MKVRLKNWPWQYKNYSAVLDFDAKVKVGEKWGWKHPGGMGRFGGGWRWKLGVTMGQKEAIVDLVIGSIYINWVKPLPDAPF